METWHFTFLFAELTIVRNIFASYFSVCMCVCEFVRAQALVLSSRPNRIPVNWPSCEVVSTEQFNIFNAIYAKESAQIQWLTFGFLFHFSGTLTVNVKTFKWWIDKEDS